MEQHHPNEIVAWIDGATATSEESEVIYDVLVRRRLRRFEDVAEAPSSTSCSATCSRGGPSI